MKRAQLKKILKPIVEECLHEAIISSGVLATVIAEVMKGARPELITEQRQSAPPPVPRSNNTQIRDEQKQKLRETKTRMMEAIGKDAYKSVDLFEGTEPLDKGGSPGSDQKPRSPLAHADPRDPGVDISGLIGVAGNAWKKLV